MTDLPARLDAGAPKGRQLREILEGLVAGLPPGSPLPSERELAERYGVARMTVRGEVERLAADGLAYRLHGRGTFVAEPRVAQAAALSSFTEDMRARGLAPSSNLRAHEVVRAEPELARWLEIAPGAEVLRLDRVRRADGTPMAVEAAHLPVARFPGIDGDPGLAEGSLFAALEERWSVRLSRAEQRVVAVALGAGDARTLGVRRGAPALRFRTLARDEDGVPVFAAVAVYRGDRYEIALEQERARP